MKPRLLVVDDNEVNVDLLEQILEDDYDVVTSFSGEDCLKKLHSESFDCVVLDIMMPGMSGTEVLQEIRKKQDRAELPVIMVTAKAQSTDVVEALKLGANDYVTKPIDAAILMARLAGLVDVRQASRNHDRGLGVLDAAPSAVLEERDRYCENCRFSTSATDRTCAECGESIPSDGWPESAEKYSLLGKW